MPCSTMRSTQGRSTSPGAIAILRISREEVFGPGMHVAPAPEVTAALALIDAKTTSDRGIVQTIVAAPRRRAEGERALPPSAGMW